MQFCDFIYLSLRVSLFRADKLRYIKSIKQIEKRRRENTRITTNHTIHDVHDNVNFIPSNKRKTLFRAQISVRIAVRVVSFRTRFMHYLCTTSFKTLPLLSKKCIIRLKKFSKRIWVISHRATHVIKSFLETLSCECFQTKVTL